MKFTPNTPFVSKTPSVVVDAGMKPGVYLFRLEVEDESGNKSRPDERVVVIVQLFTNPIIPPNIPFLTQRGEDKDSRPPAKSGRAKAKKPGRVL